MLTDIAAPAVSDASDDGWMAATRRLTMSRG